MKTFPNVLRIALAVLLVLLLVLGTAQMGLTQDTVENPIVAEEIPPDVVPPVIEQPLNVVVSATDPGGAAVAYLVPLAFDDRDGQVIVGCEPQPGGYFLVGDTQVLCWAQDAAGNLGNTVFWVTVLPFPTPVPTITPTATPEPVPTESPTSEAPSPTDEPSPAATETPTGVLTITPDPESTAAGTSTPVESQDESDDSGVIVEISPAAPVGETLTPVASETATPEGETSTPDTGQSTPTATPTPLRGPPPAVTPVPAQLGLPWPPPPGFVLITGSGPLGDLTAIWGYLDFPISQEYGHTAFSVTRPDWYGYGRYLGLDGYAHPGLDIGMPAGTPLYSPVGGTVTVSGGTNYFTFYGNGRPGVGQLSIQTDDGHEVILGHMGNIVVERGQRVSVGEFIGLSGGMNGDHLHLETRELQSGGGQRLVDPRLSFLLLHLAGAVEHQVVAELENSERAVIVVHTGSCSMDSDNSIGDCEMGAVTGVPFSVSDSETDEKTRKSNKEGKLLFTTIAGTSTIQQDDGVFAWYGGAYVDCRVESTERVVFSGWISVPGLEIETRPGERIDCNWYSVGRSANQEANLPN